MRKYPTKCRFTYYKKRCILDHSPRCLVCQLEHLWKATDDLLSALPLIGKFWGNYQCQHYEPQQKYETLGGVIEMKEFTKSDLKNRMVVELVDGERYMIVDNVLVGYGSSNLLSNYNEFLEPLVDGYLPIMRVYNIIGAFNRMHSEGLLSLLWNRSEVKEITMAEVEEKFGCKVKIVKE